jgi:hypothetical protein
MVNVVCSSGFYMGVSPSGNLILLPFRFLLGSTVHAAAKLNLLAFSHNSSCSPLPPLSSQDQISLKIIPLVALPVPAAQLHRHQRQRLGPRLPPFLPLLMCLHSKSAYGVCSQQRTKSQANASRYGLLKREMRKWTACRQWRRRNPWTCSKQRCVGSSKRSTDDNADDGNGDDVGYVVEQVKAPMYSR